MKPISVSTSDWLMSEMEKYRREGRRESERTGAVLAPPAGTDPNWLTVLFGHVDGLAVAEGSPTPARCVHFILHAAVNDPELYLRWRRRESCLLCRGGFLLLFMFKHGEATQPASFFTVKPTDTDTKGNLRRKL